MHHLRLFTALLAAFLLAACSNDPSPLQRVPLRPGVDRQMGAVNFLPSARAPGGYDAAVAPENDARGTRVGAIVAHEGGQKAQKEEEAREVAKMEAQRAKERADLDRQLHGGPTSSAHAPVEATTTQ